MMATHKWSWYIVLAVLLGGLLVGFGEAQDSSIKLHIFEVDSAKYPIIESTFSLFDTATGRVPEVNQDNITVTYGGETLKLDSFTPDNSNARQLNVVLCIDLTNSNIPSFIEEQKRTTQEILNSLNSSDYLGIVTFSHESAEVLRPLSPFNQGTISSDLQNLKKMKGDSNTFFDALTQAIAQFNQQPAASGQPGQPEPVNAIIVMTDVVKPDSLAIRALPQTERPDAAAKLQQTIIKSAQDANIHLFIIGYGKADADVLLPYGAATFGFTYLQAQLDNEFDQVTGFILDGLNKEYKIKTEAAGSANGSLQPFVIQYRNGGATASGREEEVQAVVRPIVVTFDNIKPGQAYSDEISLEPQIHYQDAQDKPELRYVEYRLAQTPAGTSDTLLRPTDSLEESLTWPVGDKQEGDYVIQLTVRDQVGNTGVGTAAFKVSKALNIRFFDPSDPTVPVPNYQTASGTEYEIYARVLSKEFDILDVTLRLQKPNGDPVGEQIAMTRVEALPQAEGTDESAAVTGNNQALNEAEDPYEIRQTYRAVLETSQLPPQGYVLSVSAKDSRQNLIYTSAPINITLSPDNTSTASLNIIVLVALFLFIVVIVAAVTYTRNSREARERKLKEAEEARQIQERAAVAPFMGVAASAASMGRMGYLKVVAGKSPTGKDVYTLQPGKRHLLGRSQTSDIILMGLKASRSHAEIQGDTSGLYTLRDLYPDKGNRTELNGQILQGSQTLMEGSQLKIGDTVLYFTYQAPK